VFQRLEREEELAKADRKQLKHNNKRLKEKLKDERRVEREAVKLVRKKEKAELANQKAERAAKTRHQKEARDAQKALQLSQRSNRIASKPTIRNKKRVRRAEGATAGALSEVTLSAQPTVVSSRGRHINRLKRYI
jgi:hypothetical protein